MRIAMRLRLTALGAKHYDYRELKFRGIVRLRHPGRAGVR